MDTTPLYRALINAGSEEELAKEAAATISKKIDTLESEKISTIEKDVAELKILVRLNTAGILIIIGILAKMLTVS